LQEVAPESFATDFDFMKELGYESEMFKKGRFRPATFWKRNMELVDVAHKDRCLLTALRNNGQTWYVLNCHLQAGKEGPRRLRQIHEGVKAVLTMAKKLQKVTRELEQSKKLIVCGDFNGGSECAAIRYLEDGVMDENFREDGEPVTSSRKNIPLTTSPMSDVATSIDRPPPPTLVVPELISLMVEGEQAYENPQLSNDMIVRLQRIYERLATTQVKNNNGDEYVMNIDDVEKYLVAINNKLGRGSEFREAARQMGWRADNNAEAESDKPPTITLPRDGILTLDGFLNIYQAELRQGKFWGIAHDVAVLGEPLPQLGVHQSRYDRIYYSSSTCQPVAVMDFLCDEPCPNQEEPSDHLPVAASFQIA
jgi:hypothetical protein